MLLSKCIRKPLTARFISTNTSVVSSSIPFHYSHKQLFESPITTQDIQFTQFLQSQLNCWRLLDHVEPVSIFIDESHSFFQESNRELRLRMRDLTSVYFTATLSLHTPLNLKDVFFHLLLKLESNYSAIFGKEFRNWEYMETVYDSNLSQLTTHQILRIPLLYPRECKLNTTLVNLQNSIQLILKTQSFSPTSHLHVPCHFFTNFCIESVSNTKIRYHFLDIANMGGVLQYHGGIPLLEQQFQIQRALRQFQTLEKTLETISYTQQNLLSGIPRLLWNTLQINNV